MTSRVRGALSLLARRARGATAPSAPGRPRASSFAPADVRAVSGESLEAVLATRASPVAPPRGFPFPRDGDSIAWTRSVSSSAAPLPPDDVDDERRVIEIDLRGPPSTAVDVSDEVGQRFFGAPADYAGVAIRSTLNWPLPMDQVAKLNPKLALAMGASRAQVAGANRDRHTRPRSHPPGRAPTRGRRRLAPRRHRHVHHGRRRNRNHPHASRRRGARVAAAPPRWTARASAATRSGRGRRVAPPPSPPVVATRRTPRGRVARRVCARKRRRTRLSWRVWRLSADACAWRRSGARRRRRARTGRVARAGVQARDDPSRVQRAQATTAGQVRPSDDGQAHVRKPLAVRGGTAEQGGPRARVRHRRAALGGIRRR